MDESKITVTHRRGLMMSLLVAALAFGCGVGERPRAASNAEKSAKRSPSAKAARKRVPIAKLLAQAEADLDKMSKIWELDFDTGRLLGKLNGDFQRRGYFSRIPSAPSLAPLESSLRGIASRNALILQRLGSDVPKLDPLPAPELAPGERWRPSDAELWGTIKLEIDLQGPVSSVARFIDDLAARSERLIVIIGDQSIPGGVRLMGKCWFERGTAMPKLVLPWPELEERLRAAGYDPADTKLAADPQVIRLRSVIDQGRQRIADVRNTLTVAADFPRWLARERFFEEKSVKATSMRGAVILGSVAGG